ncbi:unnamed protein product, partial [Bubo scandiacus]
YVTKVRLQEEGKAVVTCKQNCTGKNLTPELMLICTPKKKIFMSSGKCREAAEEAAVVAERGPTRAAREC